MAKRSKKYAEEKAGLMYGLLLAVGFSLSVFLRFYTGTWGSGPAGALWVFVFLLLSAEYRSKREQLLTAAVFCLGYSFRFLGAFGNIFAGLVVFAGIGCLLYAAFFLYGAALNRFDHLPVTLAFPVIWLALYFLATLLRIPSFLRVDILFTDIKPLIRAEAWIGSVGFCLVLLWVLALLEYAVRKHRAFPAFAGFACFSLLLLPGILYPGSEEVYTRSLRIAYTTGPYGGNFMDYVDPSLEEDISGMERSADEAAAQGAVILAFNEEAFEMKDTDEENFLALCSEKASEDHIHMLVGLDISDTDGSEGDKSQNKLVWIDDEGTIQGTYLKNRLIPFIESNYEPGEGMSPSIAVQTDDVTCKISYLICYDSNFPFYVGGIDEDTDILILPSWDWKAIEDFHREVCRALAVENRLYLVKPTYDGISIVAAPDGSVLHTSSTADTGYETVHVVDVPVK